MNKTFAELIQQLGTDEAATVLASGVKTFRVEFDAEGMEAELRLDNEGRMHGFSYMCWTLNDDFCSTTILAKHGRVIGASLGTLNRWPVAATFDEIKDDQRCTLDICGVKVKTFPNVFEYNATYIELLYYDNFIGFKEADMLATICSHLRNRRIGVTELAAYAASFGYLTTDDVLTRLVAAGAIEAV